MSSIGEPSRPPTDANAPRGSVAEVFAAFLRLGLTSFGGPVAHLGYFHEDIVVRRKWLDEKTYVDLVALSQFLPGPASSKVGIAIGLSRAGYAGAFGGLDVVGLVADQPRGLEIKRKVRGRLQEHAGIGLACRMIRMGQDTFRVRVMSTSINRVDFGVTVSE